MRIYHGSEFIIKRPEYEKGSRNNDYGQGFYCTENIDLARGWAVRKERDGYVNIYEIDMTPLRVVDLNSPDHCVLHWITLLLDHRHFDLETPLSKEAYRYLNEYFMPDIGEADIITGYRADDSHFSYAQDFVNGDISVSQLNRAMKNGHTGDQVFIKSRKAFDSIEYIGSVRVSADTWYERKINRDLKAKEDYRSLSREAYVSGELYMIRIIDEEVKPDDARL